MVRDIAKLLARNVAILEDGTILVWMENSKSENRVQHYREEPMFVHYHITRKDKEALFFLHLGSLHQKNAGLYKCVVNNKYGEINVNLSLIIEVAPVIRDRPIVKKVEKKKSAVLQCAVQGTQNIDVQCFKEGQGISATKGGRFSVENLDFS